MLHKSLNYSHLVECFTYADGKLLWKRRPREHFTCDRSWNRWNNRYAGTEAGWLHHHSGYMMVNIACHTHKLHRVIFALCSGADPGLMIVDHINGDKLDNRYENLRLATKQENTRHGHRARRQNTCGVRGVTQDRRTGKYVAKITVDGKSRHLGVFDALNDAAECRSRAARQLFGLFAGTA